MAQPLSIEMRDWTYLITTRTAGSKLWFIKNKELEERILGCLARYQEIYGAILYAFIIMGNHYHLLANFPGKNRALFMRDFNSAVARLVGRHVKAHGRRSVWARRYAYQIVPTTEDIRHWFFYCALNPVLSGIRPQIQQYSSYNSFFDASSGKEREYKWVDWSKYLMKKRYNAKLKPEDFSKTYTLRFTKLPDIQSLEGQAYTKNLWDDLEGQRLCQIEERKNAGKGFMGKGRVLKQAAGDSPKKTKSSSRYSYRPIVLSLCAETKREVLGVYFSILELYSEASARFRRGEHSVQFPPGTYRPPVLAPA